MTTLTSSLTDKTFNQLSEMAEKLDLPKNQILEKALIRYFIEVERQLYADSFREIAKDEEISMLAEIGFVDYIQHINSLDEKFVKNDSRY